MCLAIPGRLVTIEGEGEFRVGDVDFGGVSRSTSLAFVPEARLGDYLLVHVGFALAVIDEAVAAETLEALAMLEALTDREFARDGSASFLVGDEGLPRAETEGGTAASRWTRRLH